MGYPDHLTLKDIELLSFVIVFQGLVQVTGQATIQYFTLTQFDHF